MSHLKISPTGLRLYGLYLSILLFAQSSSLASVAGARWVSGSSDSSAASIAEACPDSDLDGWADCTVPGCDASGLVCGDCDDTDEDIHPGADEVCNSKDDDCDDEIDEDNDGDGYAVCDEEAQCNPADVPDGNPLIYPGADEICNGTDDDCNGSIDDGPDADGDLHDAPCDCDDADEFRFPGNIETCNHKDDDCDAVDEGFDSVLNLELIHDPEIVGYFFGYRFADVGDVDGDDVPDFAVGNLGDPTAGAWNGSVVVLSGADRSLICRAVNDQPHVSERLGETVVALGDIDGDDVPDFAAAAPYSQVQAYEGGKVVLFSGDDCSVLAHCTDPAAANYDRLGQENGLGAGDVTGDGISEVIAGAYVADPGGLTESGKVVVFQYSAPGTCSVLYTLTDPDAEAYDYLGVAVAGVGDLSGDGIPDILVGEPRDDAGDYGSVLVFSGGDGSLVRRLTDPTGTLSDWLGWSVAASEDLNGDGWPEVLAGARYAATSQNGDAGRVVVFSGKDGSVLFRSAETAGAGSEQLGYSVASVPDVDGDMRPEILAGAPYHRPSGGLPSEGRALLLSGADGSHLDTFADPNGKQADYAGFCVAALRDVNGDGAPEYLIGQSHDDVPKHGVDRGTVLLFLRESDCDSDGYGPTGIDCDDTDGDIYEGHAEICDSKDNDCDLATDEDDDGDGYDACAEEASCDPADEPNANPLMYPGASEICNGLDDDCDGSVDNGDDLDGDGVETPCDCNDDPATGGGIHPGATEVCNHVDENCGGGVDEGFDEVNSHETVVDSYPVASDFYGWSVAGVEDVTADGVPDFVVGAPSDDTAGWDWGQATLYSGSDRRVHCRTAVPGGVGRMVAGISDVDGDTTPDFVASAPGADAVILFSGSTCLEIDRCEDPYAVANYLGDERGLAVADVTGDGIPEILAGAPVSNVYEHHAGIAFVFSYSSSTGCSVLHELYDPDGAFYDYFGYSIAGVGDVTGDGVPDIAVGEYGDDSITDVNGAVLIFSGADGSFVRRLLDPDAEWRDYMGYAVAGIEDLNDDGWPEILAGAELGNRPVTDAGHVTVFSGKDGTVLRRISDPDSVGGERLGWSLAVIDDVDGDGVQDIVAGARYADSGASLSGRAVVFSGKTGGKLRTLDHPNPATSDYFGYAVAEAGDITGDGITEILVSTPFTDGAAGADTGSVTIFAIESDCDGDGVGPWHDCGDGNPDLWSAPSECRDLLIDGDKATLTWNPPLDPGNTSGSVLYDTLRSSDASDFDTADCLESDEADLTASDSAPVGLGSLFFYLVRGQNDCGEGDLGDWGSLPDDMYPRTGRSCP
jgi:hypothetical protein